MEQFKEYIGVKVVKARPMLCPKDNHTSKAGDPGYEVEYRDGYRSWCPKAIFEEANIETEGLPFRAVLEVAEGQPLIMERLEWV